MYHANGTTSTGHIAADGSINLQHQSGGSYVSTRNQDGTHTVQKTFTNGAVATGTYDPRTQTRTLNLPNGGTQVATAGFSTTQHPNGTIRINSPGNGVRPTRASVGADEMLRTEYSDGSTLLTRPNGSQTRTAAP